MRLSPRLALAASLLTLPALGLASAHAASGGNVQRYQLQSIHITTAAGSGHDYSGVLSPCDGSFTATGTTVGPGGVVYTENVTGVLGASTLDYTSAYVGNVVFGGKNHDPYGYTVTATRALDAFTGTYQDTAGYSGPVAGSVTTGPGAKTYANHGQYVSSQGGGSDAAHSCIGMPVQAQS